MAPDEAVGELDAQLGRGGLAPGEARRLRALRLIARVIGDPDGDHGAAVDDVVDGWPRGGVGEPGDVSSITLDLPGRAGSWGPVTITAVEGEQGTLDIEVRPGGIPLSVRIGVTVMNGRILLDLSGAPDALPGVDLVPIKRRVLALVRARNAPSGRFRPVPGTLEEMRADVGAVIRELEAAGVEVTAGAVREVYGGPASGDPANGIPPWEPNGDPSRPEVPPDTLDPVMEAVLRELGLPGAGPGPEPLPGPTAGAVGAAAPVDRSSLPLVPSGSPVAIQDRPVVALSNNVGVLGTGGDPVRWWVTVRCRYGEEEYIAEIDRRHIDRYGTVDLTAVAELLATRGVVVEPRWARVSPQTMNGTGARIAGPSSWEPVDPWVAPPAHGTPAKASGAMKTKWRVAAGVGGLTVSVFLLRGLTDGGAQPDEPPAVTTTVESAPDGGVVSTTEPPASAPSTTQSTPSIPSAVEPPPGYTAPGLSFASDGPPERVADRGSLWGTVAWPTVVSAAKPGAVLGPPPTVYPRGAVFEAEFVIDAACGADGCVYTTPRCCDDATGLAVDVPLTLDGLVLSGPGDDLTEGCSGDSGVQFTVSDLTVIGSRLVPTYLTGRRWFDEDCPTWTRTLENTYNAHYVDRPSLTPP